ncbi:MAG: hypothetical protein ABW148_16200 [Sedimenticola sp.]
MNLFEKSLEIALKAHSGQRDKVGKAYILHPLRIMAKMETEVEMSVALLHDALEDSDLEAADLLDEGIPATVVDAVQSLTKGEGENYEIYLERVLENELACKIKKADIEDNINILRLSSVTDRDLERIKKYHKAWWKLKGFVS